MVLALLSLASAILMGVTAVILSAPISGALATTLAVGSATLAILSLREE